MKVLVTGSNGQLGRSLNDCLQDKNRTSFLFKTSNELDITNSWGVKVSQGSSVFPHKHSNSYFQRRHNPSIYCQRD